MENFTTQPTVSVIDQKINELQNLGVQIQFNYDLGSAITAENFYVFTVYARWNESELIKAIDRKMEFVKERPWLKNPQRFNK